MGTLVKEDFGRPDRANTMVRNLGLVANNYSCLTIFIWKRVLVSCWWFLTKFHFSGNETWFL